MNYTENCHLPQWDGDDRVLRTDFNEAFAVLEKIGTDHARVRAVADGLVRDAYRCCVRQRVLHGGAEISDAAWINPLCSLEDAGGEGHGWGGKYGICLGTAALPIWEGAAGSSEEEAFISTVPTYTEKSKKAVVQFTSDGYGMLERVLVWSWMNSHYTSEEYTFSITCTRLDTGEVVKEAGPFTSSSSQTVYKTTWCKVDFPMEPHVSYRMEFSVPEEAKFYGLGGFVMACSVYSNPPNQITALSFSERTAPSTLTKTVVPPEDLKRATGIVRWRGAGSTALSVNGEEMTHIYSREVYNAMGEPCTETTFSINRLPEGPFELTLRMDRGDGDLIVYDYGLIWN